LPYIGGQEAGINQLIGNADELVCGGEFASGQVGVPF
jgi:hypothetical protein